MLGGLVRVEDREKLYMSIIPDSSVRNNNTMVISKMVASFHRTMREKVSVIDKKINIQQSVRSMYIVNIKKEGSENKVEFTLEIPKKYRGLASEKLSAVWSKATVTEKENIGDIIKPKSIIYQMKYVKEDAFSLETDSRNNDLISSVINIVDTLEDGESISIIYNLIPRSQNNWAIKHKSTIERWKNNGNVNKDNMDIKDIARSISFVFLDILEGLVEGISEFTGDSNTRKKDQSLINQLREALSGIGSKLSNETKNKREQLVVETQIIVVSNSDNKIRANSNAVAVCQGFSVISGDNELNYKRVKKAVNIDDRVFRGVASNIMSVNECRNFIQLPGKTILDKYKINHVNVLQNRVIEELRNGYIHLGDSIYKGIHERAYMSTDKNLANMGLVVMGPQGCGKTKYFGNYANNVIKKGEGLIVIDMIKNCELCDEIMEITPKDKLVLIDLGDHKYYQSFGFNEIKNKVAKDEGELLENANLQSQLIVSFINAINPKSELSPRMRRGLVSACNIVFIHNNKSLKDVVDCLKDHRVRKKYIDSIPKRLLKDLEIDVYNLEDMDDKDKEGEVIGTKGSMVDFALDRINLLMEDIKLRRMFNKDLDNNLDFVEMMNEGKVILIKIPESKFPTQFHKNILVTFFVSKLWLSCQIRGEQSKVPLRNHAIIDEIFQSPTCLPLVASQLVQARKFQFKYVLSCHYLDQVSMIKDDIKGSGSSYMLMQGTDKKNFEELKDELKPYVLDDLLNLKRYHSLNLVKCDAGLVSFVTKLPKPLS